MKIALGLNLSQCVFLYYLPDNHKNKFYDYKKEKINAQNIEKRFIEILEIEI